MIAAKVAMVDLVVELNLPLSTLVRINKVFKKSLRIQTLLKGQLKMFLFLVLSSSFLCLLFFFSDIRGRHVWSNIALQGSSMFVDGDAFIFLYLFYFSGNPFLSKLF